MIVIVTPAMRQKTKTATGNSFKKTKNKRNLQPNSSGCPKVGLSAINQLNHIYGVADKYLENRIVALSIGGRFKLHMTTMTFCHLAHYLQGQIARGLEAERQS